MSNPAPVQPIHGNYHAYYSRKQNATGNLDPRLSLLPKDIFAGKRVLDVGCNEGWVTVDIAKFFAPFKVIGVDIDGDLIRAAWKRRKLVWSLQAPPAQHDMTSESEEAPSPRPGKKRKRIDAQSIIPINESLTRLYPVPRSTKENMQSYFPLAMEYMFEPLPIPSVNYLPEHLHRQFPHNVAFYAADWNRKVDHDALLQMSDNVGGIEKEDRDGYDVVIGFSITKWIHLNDGDEGIVRFFRKVHTVLHPRGVFLLEPQEWEEYAKVRRISPILAENYKGLKLRPSEFPSLLEDIGFKRESPYTVDGRKRSILVFRKL
ncbi:hypothetical protein PIIN_05986 [Serendipita indica DSM 11827]|uniref:RNA methyltransferase n=1 Tax=Serendipita indica (strain DSM 11827) TaxID=1109443 RepID=G4TL58_SERID|nr:hypothetical protein PIIN_05986 [Serendipita indica DSM 11827]